MDTPHGTTFAVDWNGSPFEKTSTGPMYIYPLATSMQQAQLLHSLWMDYYNKKTNAVYSTDQGQKALAVYKNAIRVVCDATINDVRK